MKPKILVTGGAGYIGSHTVIELANAGYEPIILDNLCNSSKFALKGIEKILGYIPEFHPIDLLDYPNLEGYLKKADIQGTIHFAAYKAVGESVKNPLKYYRNNLDSLINLLYLLQEKSKDFIFSSSCTVYGQPDILPVTEDSPFKPAESPYGFTKQVCERILSDAALSEKYNIIALRYFNPVGAHPTCFIGELPLGVPQNLVPFITQAAIGKRDKLTVFGSDYPTPDGSCIRDYIHVVDVAKAHVKALERLKGFSEEKKSQGNFEFFNLGTGKGNSVLEVINTFERVNKVKLPYHLGPRRPGDVIEVWGDVKKSLRDLSWKAERDLDNMMETAWNWELYLRDHAGEIQA
jgi:UDP-glucose 4-epimerase